MTTTGGHGNGNGGPWWVRAVTTLGLATVLALGFFWWVTTKVDAELASIKADTARFDMMQEKLGGVLTAHVDASGHALAEIRYLLMQLCLQGARSGGTDPRTCVPPREQTSDRVPAFERGRRFD